MKVLTNYRVHRQRRNPKDQQKGNNMCAWELLPLLKGNSNRYAAGMDFTIALHATWTYQPGINQNGW